MRTRNIGLFLMTFFVTAPTLFAQEVIEIAGTDWVQWFFGGNLADVLSRLLLGLLSLVSGYVFKRLSDATGEKDAVDAVKSGVTETYEFYVKKMKESAEDGKLTDEEREQARKLAINKAMEVAKGPALRLLRKWGEPKIRSLIEEIIAKRKK